MNEWLEVIAAGVIRTTVVTSAAALLASALLALLRVRSAGTHRLVWLLVIAQGWLLVPYTFSIEVADQPKPRAAQPAAEATAPTPLVATEFDVRQFPPKAATAWIRPAHAALLLWFVGIVTLLVLAARRYATIARAGPLGQPVDKPEWADEWARVRADTSVRGPVELRISEHLGPLVCWVPRVFLILVPRTLWERLPSGDRLAILRHELAHCERGDLWKNLAVWLLALPQWFNPLAWLAVRRFEEAGEWACDEQVARQQNEQATDYAATLVRVVDFAAEVPCGALGVTGGQLSRRVKRLIHLPNKEVREMRGLILPVLLVAIGLFQAVRIERLAADEPTAKPTVQPTATERPVPPKSKWASHMPPYVIEPPDILLIDVKKVVPKPPHKVEAFDGLLIRAKGVDDEVAPIADAYFVQPEGQVDLGPSYGTVKVVGLTIAEAKKAIAKQLAKDYPEADVSVSLAVAAGTQQIVGEHLVGPDGRVNLGSYGSVYLTDMTIEEAKKQLEDHLSEFLVEPEVTIDIFAYNSKKYYIITKGAGFGDNIVTAPITGNETVLDAIAQIGGLGTNRAAKIWVSRPAPNGVGTEQVLPVNYDELVGGADTSTNHQLWPGDRLFIEIAQKKNAAPVASVHATIRLARDPEMNLRNVNGLQSGTATIGDSHVLLGLLRVLENNQLAKVVAAPTVTAEQGQRMSISSCADDWTAPARDGEKSAESAEVGARQSERQLHIGLTYGEVSVQSEFAIEVMVDSGGYQRQQRFATEFALHEGQSCLIRVPDELTDQDAPDLYVMVTRER